MLPIGLSFIISYLILISYSHIEETQDAIDATNHDIREELAENEDKSVDDNKTVGFDFNHVITNNIRSDSIESARAIKGWYRDQIKNHKTKINDNYFDNYEGQ